MTVIVQISDTHFGTEVPEVVTAIRQCISEIKPALIVLSGDITQRARPEQFEAAAAFMKSLPESAQLVIPGNHDIPLCNPFARFLRPYANYTRAFGSREGFWGNGKIGVIGYDATNPWRHTRGRLDDRILQRGIERGRAQLDPGALLIACAHQPLLVAKEVDADEVLLHNQRTARLFSEAGVDMVLSGHVHFPLLTTTKQAFPDLPRSFILAGAGTAISHRIRKGAPNSFHAIKISAGLPQPVINIMPYVYDAKSKAFRSGVLGTFLCEADGWCSA